MKVNLARIYTRTNDVGFFYSVIVIACLVLISFWLPPLEENRINISCVSLICHCPYLIDLWWKLRISGDKNPLIG